MRSFLQLAAACIASVLLYFTVFGFVVSRPLVVDQAQRMTDKKLDYARATGHPKIAIIANSNARFSHSCAVLEQALHRPCVNLGVSGDVGFDWTLQTARQLLAAGDLVYMPIEYDIYARPRLQMITGIDAAYRFRHDKASLMERGVDGALQAAFMYSLPTLMQSIGEMGLDAAGIHRRFSLDTLDRQGDETGHDGPNALLYTAVIRAEPQNMPDDKTLFDNPGGSQAAIVQFLDWCRAHHVAVVGGLPTVYDDAPIPEKPIGRLKEFYARHGAAFLVLPNRSQYPRSAFYDSNYHLRESWQKQHSRLLAASLAPLLP